MRKGPYTNDSNRIGTFSCKRKVVMIFSDKPFQYLVVFHPVMIAALIAN